MFLQKKEIRDIERRKNWKYPVKIAQDFKHMIDSGEVASQAELARKLGLSRAMVTQYLNLLKIDKTIILQLSSDGYNDFGLTERKLRKVYLGNYTT